MTAPTLFILQNQLGITFSEQLNCIISAIIFQFSNV